MTYRNRRKMSVTAALLAMLTLTAFSPAFTQVVLPGSPQQRINLNQSNIFLSELDESHEGLLTLLLPTTVNSGFLVMTEDNTSQTPTNWSDIAYFHNVTVNTQLVGELRFLSDTSENGFTDAELAPLGIPGLTLATIQAQANTQYRPEVDLSNGVGVIYAAPNPNLPPGDAGTTATLTYTLISESPEPSAFAFAGASGVPLLCFAYRRLRRKR